MYANILHNQILSKPFTLHISSHSPPSPRLSLSPLNSATGDDTSTAGDDVSTTASPPPEPVEIRFRRGSRRRRLQQQREQEGIAGEQMPRKEKEESAPKSWEEKSIAEKALELYMGEKGLLFWLNKFAYASIFIIIGGWILFRFVGPALNLYQLDSPPLSPDSMFKGSS